MQSDKITVKTKDGVSIAVTIHAPQENSVKGAVIVSHGFGEHSGSYNEIAGYLNQADYVCVVFDQRGHGSFSEESPEKRKKLLGITPGYKYFLEDIDAIIAEIKQKAPNVPVILYGHSMGGNIVANYLLAHNQSDITCAVLESPWLGLYKELNPLVAGLAKLLGHISPGMAIINKLTFSDITDDELKQEEFKNDPLYHNRISFRMFSGIKNGCAYAVKNASRITIPIYLTYAKNDRIVSNNAIQKFIGTCGKNVTIKEYDSCHAIHNSVIRKEFYQDFIKFIEAYCLAYPGVV